MTKQYTAHCACGACKFEFDTEASVIANCHRKGCKGCKGCKKASGGELPGMHS